MSDNILYIEYFNDVMNDKISYRCRGFGVTYDDL